MKYAYKNVVLPQIISDSVYKGAHLSNTEKQHLTKHNEALGYVYKEELGRWVHPTRTWFGKRSKTSQIIDEHKVGIKNTKNKYTRKHKNEKQTFS